LKIEKKFSLSKLARTTKKRFQNLFLFFLFIFFASARTLGCVRADAVFTTSANSKNPSAGKTASAG
jgi:hypothetical protein